jgi:hypothetical protein
MQASDPFNLRDCQLLIDASPTQKRPPIRKKGTVSLNRKLKISCRTRDSAYATALAQTESARARKTRSVGLLIM